VGDKRIGIACSDPTGFLPSPLGVYRRASLAADLDHIVSLAGEREARIIVVGLPINMNGSEGPQADKTRMFAEALAKRGLTVELWDERLTTVEATRMLQERGMKRQVIDRHVDELAATLILEGYLLTRAGPRTGGYGLPAEE
jgi:putative Holliday junction resolvase